MMTKEEVQAFLIDRIPVLKDSKKNILDGINYEQIMLDADQEYQPMGLREKQLDGKNKILIEDENLGLRGSRVVSLGEVDDDAWRSDVSEPTLYVKVQTALSILIDQNPEAVFKAVLPKYKKRTAIAQAMWKRNWKVAGSKETLKLFIFDLAKYGWACGRTYPRILKRECDVLVSFDPEDPSKNKYKKKTIIDYNDIYRQKLDPYRTWIDDMANLTDQVMPLNDWYFEEDYSQDRFLTEFGMYKGAEDIQASNPHTDNDTTVSMNGETQNRNDIITVGIYENKLKDLYVIYIPKDDVVLYHSPLPNDDKNLSFWDACWTQRDPRTRYGLGLFEIIKGNKVLYDRLSNMTMDQLVLSVYSMLFYTGVNNEIGDGDFKISPGVAKQKLPGTEVDQMKFEFDPSSFQGVTYLRERMDEASAITPTLQGEVTGKTVTETLHAKDAALKRLNIPLSNIAGAIEKDAMLTLSWASQVYSLPDVMEFTDKDELDAFMEDNDIEHAELMTDESGMPMPNKSGKIQADFPRQLGLSLTEDDDKNLIESNEDRFFTVGVNMEKENLRWKGIVSVSAQSIVAPSPELERQRKLELFNLILQPINMAAQALAQGMADMALATLMPVMQILEIQNEKPESWLPADMLKLVNDPETYKAELEQKQQMAQAAQAQQAQDAQPLFIDGNAPPGTDPNMPPEAQNAPPQTQSQNNGPVVPRDQISNPVRDSMNATTGVGQMK